MPSSARILLAKNMKRLRELHRISQMALAERVGCSTTLIGNIETLKRFPSAENLDRISRALAIPLYELFMEDSAAIARATTKTEVMERIGKRVLSALDDALGSEEYGRGPK